MPRRRKSGFQPASLNLRWHNIADPNTSSVDIMSSPDPLNEPTISFPSFAPQSASRRVTRSQRSQRFISLAESPRKQIFELEVGDSSSPQRLLVTVETEGDGDDDMATTSSGTRRKLFKSPVQSPTVRRIGDDTITTSIPLRESGEDELTTAMTPSRRRSRPRLSNGTPIPTAGVKRRARSPIKRSPRRQRNEKFGGENTMELHLEEKENIQTTPKSAKRGRPPKNPVVEPSSELGTTKRGRRRQAMAPDELVEIAEEAAVERSYVQKVRRTSETDAVDLVHAPSERQADGDAVSNADTESDIWMATLDDEATPRATARPSTIKSASKSVLKDRPPTGRNARNGDHDYHAPETSDHSSVDDHPNDFSSQNNDTIAQGEDFSMIFMHSLPSLQASYNGNSTFVSTAHDDEELGEETHLIINNTLESLRREVAQTSDPVEDITVIEIPEIPETEEQPEEVEFVPIIRESARAARLSLSPWWTRKPKKMGSSPLRHQTLRSAAKRSGRLFSVEQMEDEPTPTRAGKQAASTHSHEDHSNVYDDSFSEIPQNYLDAANPRPLNFSATQTDREVDLMEYGLEGGEEEQAEQEHAQDIEELVEEPAEERLDEQPEELVEEAVEYEEDVAEGVTEEAVRGGLFSTRLDSTIRLGPRKLPTPDMSSPVRHIEEEEEERERGHGEHEEYEEHEEHEEYEEQHEEHEELEHEGVFEQEQEHDSELEEAEEEREEEIGEYEDEERAEVEELEEQHEELGEHEAHEEEQEEEIDEHQVNEEHEDQGHEDDEDHDDHEDHEEYPYGFSWRTRMSNSARRRSHHDVNYVDEDIRPNFPERLPERREPTPEHEEQPAKVTPLHQMSSPLQDPQSLPQEHAQEKVVRPVLSSIMRAGRVLQSVTSDPPSPGDREKQLGSPFRSSASKESSYSAREDRPQLLSKSPPPSLNFGGTQSAVSKVPVNYGAAADTEAFSMHVGGADQAHDRDIRDSLHRKRPSSRESVASSLGNTPSSNGATGWVEKVDPISPGLRRDNTLRKAAQSSSMRNTIPLGQVDGAGEEPDTVEEEEEEEEEVEEEQMEEEQTEEEQTEEEQMEEEQMEEEQMEEEQMEEEQMEEEQMEEEQMEEEEDDEDDIDLWEFEAQREAPPHQAPPHQASRPTMMPSAQDHNMVPGPSRPWRAAQQAIEAPVAAIGLSNAPPKTSQLKRTIGQQPDEIFEDEEHSLVSRNQPEKEPETATKSKRFDLSSFFSSPAAIPGLLAEKFRSVRSKAPAKPVAQQAEPVRPRQEPPIMATTSMFPRLPQNDNRQRNLLRTDPVPSPVRSDPPRDEPVVEGSLSPIPLEEPHLPVISQKQNFTPRPRQASNTFFQPSSSHSQATATPPRMQLTHEDIQRWQQETSNASEGSPNLQRLLRLRPLPPKHASPKKSSLRSPLKPHTPGRVVEFTSGVLSPAEQARIRDQRSRANGGVSEESINAVPATSTPVEPQAGKGSMGRQQQKQPPQIIPSRIIKPAGVKKRPLKKRLRREPPSETVWTRQHWIFLDTLLQMRRQSPFGEEYAPVSQKYLGKIITSMGESMVLEKWHLECIDAFKSQIGGWDEAELAKRLFALILGEARRRRSSVDQSPGVMFH